MCLGKKSHFLCSKLITKFISKVSQLIVKFISMKSLNFCLRLSSFLKFSYRSGSQFFYDDVGDSSSESQKDVTLPKKNFYIFALSQFKLNIKYKIIFLNILQASTIIIERYIFYFFTVLYFMFVIRKEWDFWVEQRHSQPSLHNFNV